ncbi:MAG: hypothetical protein O9282_08340 [Flavobacterium sp.]|jgi:hypothetical protein|uniref:hypothetical protein n=1 Tax=Flavobacterium sp. TaxID=239 RepID=UPI0022C98BCC|nr:hypothetical protein [Flavobacterium sp.]MCZ8089552.1 hypothetical protein [Flavobacterium sp.]MCZ8331306.1 hypothetical protein [Flavobacterium sp.]
MSTINYNYKIAYKLDENGNRIIELTQRELSSGGNAISIDIPENDLPIVVSKLSNIFSIIDEPIIPFDEKKEEIFLEPNIIQTLVALFLSGVPVKDLATQYNYPEETIKSHLEYKGIVIFDEI